MTTITIKNGIALSKNTFENLEDLREYLNELRLETIQTDALFEELEKRDTAAQRNPDTLRTLDQVLGRLNDLK